ncbi:MAG: short chain dehydrogenase/reductase family oxidoreductase [Devosia sp.]|nr:short chain dehydrogenase/reductase family oxidoreductase [Devosia sp.]
MDGKVCIITGATSGVGRETARLLAEQGATVFAVGRNAEKGRETIKWIGETARYPERVSFLRADLARLDDVRALAAEIDQRTRVVDVLINNAGVINTSRKVTVDGLEETFAVNHLAHFLLTVLLLDRLQAAAQGRIINLSSNAHVPFKMHFDDLQSERGFSGFAVYGRTKLANLLFTYELARRLTGGRVTVNAIHPGAVASNFSLNNGGLATMAMRLLRPFFISPAKAAETSVYLAGSAAVAEVSGQYFYRRKPHASSKRSHDSADAKALWDASESLTDYPFRSLLPERFVAAAT